MANIYGRQTVLPLTNKSGGGVIAGDVVIIDTGNDGAFTTTTSGGYGGSVGIAQETIANNATGRVLTAGYAALVNVPSSQTRGHFIKTHTVAKQATGASSRSAGSFGQLLTGGSTPVAWLWGMTDNAGAAGETVATSTIWDAKGDLVAATGADAATKVTVGANNLALIADSAISNGVKWAHPVLTASTADCTADVTLTADTIADVTGCSLSLAAGTWVLMAQLIFQGSSATYDYTLAALTDGSNVVVSEIRGTVNNAAPLTWPLFAVVSPGSTTTYKIRGQSGRSGNKTLRYSSGTNIGSRLIALRVA